MADAITHAAAYDDVKDLDRFILHIGDMLSAVLADGRFLPSELLARLRAALPEALEALADLREALRPELVDLATTMTLPVQDNGQDDPEWIGVPPSEYPWPPSEIVLQVQLARHGLAGPIGRAKLAAFWHVFWAWDRHRRHGWLARTSSVAAIPLAGLVAAADTGHAACDFLALIGSLAQPPQPLQHLSSVDDNDGNDDPEASRD